MTSLLLTIIDTGKTETIETFAPYNKSELERSLGGESASSIIASRICTCAFCGEWLYQFDTIADNKVFKCGELSYIELAHATCAPAVSDYWEGGKA